MTREWLEQSVLVYTPEEFEADMKHLAGCMRKAGVVRKIDSVYGIPRGGIPAAQRLAQLLKKPCITDEKDVSGRTLVVDDIADTGATLARYLDLFPGNYTATIFYNPVSDVRPNFFARLKWIFFPWEDPEELKQRIEEISP